MKYRYAVEYWTKGGTGNGNTFVSGSDERDARAEFARAYPGCQIDRVTSTGATTTGENEDRSSWAICPDCGEPIHPEEDGVCGCDCDEDKEFD